MPARRTTAPILQPSNAQPLHGQVDRAERNRLMVAQQKANLIAAAASQAETQKRLLEQQQQLAKQQEEAQLLLSQQQANEDALLQQQLVQGQLRYLQLQQEQRGLQLQATQDAALAMSLQAHLLLLESNQPSANVC